MRDRCGSRFGLSDLFVVFAAVGLLLTVVGPATNRANEMSKRVQCASNLRQIGQAIALYSNNETRNGNAFPRTYFHLDAPLTQTDAGSTIPSPGYNQPASFADKGSPSPVGENNVMASMFLLLKTQDLKPDVFNCPSTGTTPDSFGATSPGGTPWTKYSCWDAPANRYLSYSMQAPFPSSAAIQTGFKWNAAIAPDVAVLADINPGTPELTSISPSSSRTQIQAANSPNHDREGQNVAYGDFHVEWCPTPFAGAIPTGSSTLPAQDNVYTYGLAGAPSGVIGPSQDRFDSILLPIVGANPPAAPLMGPEAKMGIIVGVAALVLGLVVIVVIVLLTRRRPSVPPPLPPMA